MTAVQQRIASLAVAKDALRTLGYTIQQEFDFVNGKRVSRGYVARNALEVRLDAPERAGEVIDASVQAGAGRTVDRVLRIEDNRQSMPVPRPMMATMARAAEPSTDTPIETGVIEVHAQVTLTVSIK